MINTRFCSGFSMMEISSSGLPSTSRMSASAPSSITPVGSCCNADPLVVTQRGAWLPGKFVSPTDGADNLSLLPSKILTSWKSMMVVSGECA